MDAYLSLHYQIGGDGRREQERKGGHELQQLYELYKLKEL